MALREEPPPPPPPGDPYVWDPSVQVPTETIQLWQEVAFGLEKNQTVVWKNAVESLDQAHRYLELSADARSFTEKYMRQIISILVDQLPAKIGHSEKRCVEDSLDFAIRIIATDLRVQIKRHGECTVLDVLECIFNKKKQYYRGTKANWNMNHMGLPEVRINMIGRFSQEKGFLLLAEYMAAPQFVPLDHLQHVLIALHDTLPSRPSSHEKASKRVEEDTIVVCQATMNYISNCAETDLKKIPSEVLNSIRTLLQKIFDRLVSTHRSHTYDFYEFWRALALKLITSKSLPLKLFGWDQVTDLIDASASHRPPPRSYTVSGAGRSFCNGEYAFNGSITADGYVYRGGEISYVRKIPESDPDGAGKSLTLFRCTMRSQQKWWFLSEADEEQPGTDRDIDYYQHKSQTHEEKAPPPSGWVTCRNAGMDPPPRLRASGLMTPPGEEYNTLEHQLAKWAIENGIIEDVLGDSLHREIVARSTSLIRFLAFMCERDVPGAAAAGKPNAYCLQNSHLLLAWKTCTSKADAAVSHEVYQLLVSILPSLPHGLAITLLHAVQTSLQTTNEKRDYLFEVAEFCDALATSPALDNKAGHPDEVSVLPDDVRAEVLKLLWEVLTHPDASGLKNYDNLKRYVTSELRIEPSGAAHRDDFLGTCRQALSASAERGDRPVDEMLALRMVELTHFVLEACPRGQAVTHVSAQEGGLAMLLFSELIAYMTRRNADLTLSPSSHKKSTKVDTKFDGLGALSTRLRILRYAHGLTDQIFLSFEQIQRLWLLCSIPADREELMIFIASASSTKTVLSSPATTEPPPLQAQTARLIQSLEALGRDARSSVFLDLFCSTSVNWGELGEGAYQSFQKMYQLVGEIPDERKALPLDAWWRICLEAGSDVVAAQGRTDLLDIYDGMVTVHREGDTSGGVPSFGSRVFTFLVDVKNGLEAGDASSERSAERLLRILNAAIGQDGSTARSSTSSSLASLSSLSPEDGLEKAIALIPHGMRGQSCYRRVGIMAKRTAIPSQPMQGQMQHSPIGRDDVPVAQTSPRQQSTYRFTIDVHPLETLLSVKEKVASHCDCLLTNVKAISVSGRLSGSASRSSGSDSSQMSLNGVTENSVMDKLGVVSGCEMVFVLTDRLPPSNVASTLSTPSKTKNPHKSLNELFSDGSGDFSGRLFGMLLDVLAVLPWRAADEKKNGSVVDTHKLVWDLLFSMPSERGIVDSVRNTATLRRGIDVDGNEDAMVLESPQERWLALIDRKSFHRAVYVMQVIDSLLQPAPEVLSTMASDKRRELEKVMRADSATFREGFISSGGFDAVASFFASSDSSRAHQQSESRMGNAVALRILKCCLFGTDLESQDEAGSHLLRTLPDTGGLLRSLTAMVVRDEGVSTSAISDVLKFLRLLSRSPQTTETFVTLPHKFAEKFVVTLLLWEGGPELSRSGSTVGTASKIRRDMHDLVLSIPILSKHALPWLIHAMDGVAVTSDATTEFFDVLRKIILGRDKAKEIDHSATASRSDLLQLGTAVCKKLALCPRPTGDSALIDFSTGVLCDCLKLLKAIIETGGGAALRNGTSLLLKELNISRWSEQTGTKGVFALVSSPFRPVVSSDDASLIDLMGAIFDGFLSPGGSTSVAICCDKQSRQLGFDVVEAAARCCRGHDGYAALVNKIGGIISSAAPHLRHRWGQNGGGEDGHTRSMRNTAKYSGLRNQGCTCYMNSFLQQLFMMPELRRAMCAAPLPACLRTSGGSFARGTELVDKRISLQWESGISYHANVLGYDGETKMHIIRYCNMPVASVGGAAHHPVSNEEIERFPEDLPVEFVLSEGRPGKETGVFETVDDAMEEDAGESTSEHRHQKTRCSDRIQETADEASSRHLLEEVQRTFIHLDEGSRGRCFDPRALVEACNCLKLEFDVWQQNDASEFAMKLLDRLEIALKKWAPEHFRYLEHTFGLKQTKLKICKECGLKTTREENLMSIDCQIRGKTDIHEALSTMCEVELMEGNNKVFCDNCKKNTDTVLKTAISALPDMLILSLKRFDLDFNTFETVKLNSRCAFGQTLNMKRYTLEGIEAVEKAGLDSEDKDEPSPMDTTDGALDDISVDPLNSLPDEDYDYRLAGVLVHAGVAQGGHYYSFIKDRTPGGDSDKWYRFDDEDVTPFDPASIEVECFGGKVKKETKWPNGQVHTVESEQFANALMLFYEKKKPAKQPDDDQNHDKQTASLKDLKVEQSSGYDVFEPDVRRSNETHRWQTFLFDGELQAFLKGLLDLCRHSSSRDDRMDDSTSVSDESWKRAVSQMLLTFVFDVLLYSVDKGTFDDWTQMLADILFRDRECASAFVLDLAKRCSLVGANWLKTFLSDCPVRESRVAAVGIFAAAIISSSSSEAEQARLRRWSQAWQDQVTSWMPRLNAMVSMPTRLLDKFEAAEDIKAASEGRASSVGIIISYITLLLEAAPRTVRYNPELYLMIRDLAHLRPSTGSSMLRAAMNEAQIPGRLVSLVLRDRAPTLLRMAFPGATVSIDAAETKYRAETTPSSHLLPMGNNQVVGPTEIGSRVAGPPVASDFVNLYQAFGCLTGVAGSVPARLAVETEITGSRKPRIVLTDIAVAALTEVFKEACSRPEIGMGRHEIEAYLHRCGVDSSSLPTQKIADILTKYPTAEVDSRGNTGLSLQGFLAYYEDSIQINEGRLRMDLHTFGFRPDLTRRSLESRVSSTEEHESYFQPGESVAIDTSLTLRSQGQPELSLMTLSGLDSFQFHANAYSAGEPLAEQILSHCAYDRDTSKLTIETLKFMYGATASWAGNEAWSAGAMILKVLTSIRDSRQGERIMMVMERRENNVVHSEQSGMGLLPAAKIMSDLRSTRDKRYANEYQYAYNRYLALIRDMASLYPVRSWMTEHPAVWSSIERDLRASSDLARSPHQQHVRNNYLRRGIENSSLGLDNQVHSDSDMPIQESDEEDDDSRYYDYTDDPMLKADQILVDKAGRDEVNGLYVPTGTCDGVNKYTLKSEHSGETVHFSLFRCHVSNQTRHWYISIVPKDVPPGTSSDIDFYAAPVKDESSDYPPRTGWVKSGEGREPVPVITIVKNENRRDVDIPMWNTDVGQEPGNDSRM